MMNKVQLSLLIIVLSLSANTFAAPPRDPYKFFFHESWGDLPEEIAKAKEQKKSGILVFFEMDECPWCHYMKTSVLNQPEVQEYFQKHFINISIDIEGDIEMVNFKGKTTKQKDFAFKEHRVRATPVVVFFDLNGKRVHKHIGKTNGTKEFLWIGEYVVEEAYKEMPFVRYKRKKRQNK